MISSTSGDSSRNIIKWVLVQWPTKKLDIVHMRSILCPSRKVEVGRYVNLHWAGTENTALVVALSHDREMLETLMKKRSKSPVADPSWSRKMEEIHRDYSPSASSWEPSDDETTSSADSDEDIQEIRKHKVIDKKRRPLNRLSMENLVTPKHKSTPIKSRSESSLKTLRRKNVKSQDGRINKRRTDRSLPALARNIRAERNNQKIRLIKKDDYLYRTENMLTRFECIMNSVVERRKSMSPKARRLEESPEAPQWHESLKISESSKSSESPDARADNRKQQRKHMNGFLDEAQAGPSRPVEPMEEDHEDVFKRSDDEVLINNKFRKFRKFRKFLNKEIRRIKTDKNQTIQESMKRILDEIKQTLAIPEFKANEENENINTTLEPTDKPDKEWIGIGTGKTLVHKDKFKNVKWKSYTIATRSLLLAVFSRRILATHSLTGKKSPAFLHKPAKMSLDPQAVSDVISEITDKFGVAESLVRATITTKCADEAKMLRMRHGKCEDELENIPPSPNADKKA
ncbi:unnamed protein product [Spodoptera littoralis]|uniref:BEN domain-containing protein n=1 Tax=Spodoptera littoralis TaxID=7109 RepID=A0A9P0I4D9_SPOLI|nr:unnamed protein product [Spodoptera littoralis]CAH1639229.1 unnamed protein product [Spodoptera littoralis]